MTPPPRVKSSLTVSIALRMGDVNGKPGMVLRKGDPDAGGVLVVLRGREGMTVLSRIADPEGGHAWIKATGAAPVDQPAVDAYLARQVKFDPDLWVLEFETPDMVPPFEAKIL
jgi:hypothetical protein